MKRGIGRFVRQHAIALLALFIALSGTGYAASSKLLPANSVGTRQVVNHSLLKQDFKRGQLPRGPRGFDGPTGADGPRGAAVVARAHSLNSIAAGFGYPGTDDPLTANTWTQEPGESDLFIGRVSYAVGATCTVGGTTPQLQVNLFVDGSLVGTLYINQPVTPGATQSFGGVAYLLETGASGTRTLTASVFDPCQAHFTVSDLRINVVALT